MSRRDGRKPTYLRSAPPRRHARHAGRDPQRDPGDVLRTRRPQRRRPSNPIAPALLGVVLVLLVVVAAAAWLLTRPVSLTVTATPDDAYVRLIGVDAAEATGTLTVDELAPGPYTLEVARSGFATETVTVDVARVRGASLAVALEALPQTISLSTHPEGAVCRVLRDGDELLGGTAPLEGQVVSGPVTVELSLAGYNTFTRELFIDHPAELELWLDPEGQVVHLLGMADAAGAPKGIALTPDGTEVWATILDGPPSIEIFDVATRTVTDGIDLGTHGAVEIVFSADGAHAYASQMETARVFEIDTATRTVVRTFETGSAWSKVVELAPDGSRAYVANWSGNDVSVIDLATGELERRVPVARTPRGLYATPDGASLYVAGFARGDLQRIDLTTWEVTTLISTGGAMRHIVGDTARGVIFASDMARDRIYRHDIATGQTTEFVTTDEKPNTIALSPDGKVLFVSCRGANNPVSYYIPGPEWGTILLFDAESGEPLDAIVGGNQPTALAVSQDGATLAFSDFLDARLRFYEVPAYETLAAGGGGRYGPHRDDLRK